MDTRRTIRNLAPVLLETVTAVQMFVLLAVVEAEIITARTLKNICFSFPATCI